ncbi:Rossmann-like domain-containing protein [Methyloversatilis sp.]|uniref:Rossmann-like domain-containing protein n=1 Tax=Methyloversatilis sp. TaxID=2569862 RepID=UPI0035AF06EE
MSFATDYLAQIERIAERMPLPRVRALHLPPSRPDEPCRDGGSGHARGEFCALELEDGSIGLSYVLLDDTLERLRSGTGLDALKGADALALARRYASGQGVDRTLGFVCANAITRCLFDRAGYRPEGSSDSIGQMNPQPGETIGMIGLFGPLVERIVAAGARLTVIELDENAVGEREGWRVTTDAAALETCGKVLSTSTLLLNDTLDRMLAHCRTARWFAMVGPSAGCLPDALFARGVTLLGGSWVEDRAAFIDGLASGDKDNRKGRKSTSKFALTKEGWPGFEVLLERVAQE